VKVAPVFFRGIEMGRLIIEQSEPQAVVRLDGGKLDR